MSNNILLKFPGLNYSDIRIVPFQSSFTATVGNSVPGKFTWSIPLGNADKYAHEMYKGHYFHIDTYTLSASIDSNLFSNALDPTYQDGYFQLSIMKHYENVPANQSLINIAVFKDDTPLSLSYGSQKTFPIAGNASQVQPEEAWFRLTGQLIQTADLTAAGVNTVTIFVSCVIYEIINQAWIANYFLMSTPNKDIKRGHA